MDSKSKLFPKKLYACWHPVGYSQEIKADKPFGTILLDEPVESIRMEVKAFGIQIATIAPCFK